MPPMDYSGYETVPAIPEANSLIETLRAIGYNIQTAVADVVDNSISASAKNIWIHFEWNGDLSWITIRDDGNGMGNQEIIAAMRPGSKSPISERDPKDLGRFGLGLKTASFSQCRRLTVLSKRSSEKPNFWSWDLDYVISSGEWNLIKIAPDIRHVNDISKTESGTTILWENIDRVVKDMIKESENDLNNFLKIAESVKSHISMVFHRYIEQNKIRIHFNGAPVEPWDPYLRGEKATQPLPEEPLANGRVIVKPYVLPHISKISAVVHKKADGPRGWNDQQGFYIYRNERLILAGDWLGMFRKEEHSKLARIMVDIPNAVDFDWQIDIKKSVARPPSIIRHELKRIAKYTRGEAVKIYRHRGKVLQRSLKAEFTMMWQEKVRHGKRFYQVNRDHLLIKEFLESNPQTKTKMDTLLRVIEETVPVPLITLNESERPDVQGKPFEGADDNISELLKLMYKNLRVNNSREQAKQLLLFIEPFNEFPELIEGLK